MQRFDIFLMWMMKHMPFFLSRLKIRVHLFDSCFEMIRECVFCRCSFFYIELCGTAWMNEWHSQNSTRRSDTDKSNAKVKKWCNQVKKWHNRTGKYEWWYDWKSNPTCCLSDWLHLQLKNYSLPRHRYTHTLWPFIYRIYQTSFVPSARSVQLAHQTMPVQLCRYLHVCAPYNSFHSIFFRFSIFWYWKHLLCCFVLFQVTLWNVENVSAEKYSGKKFIVDVDINTNNNSSSNARKTKKNKMCETCK